MILKILVKAKAKAKALRLGGEQQNFCCCHCNIVIL